MTYNIRNGRGLDGRVDLGRVAEVIAAADPDVVGLQEVDVQRKRSGEVDQAEELGRLLGMRAAFAPCIERGCERYGIATLSKLPIMDTRQLVLPQDERIRRSEPRSAQVTRMTWPATGTELAFVNTHLSIFGKERGAQVTALLAGLDADEVIVVGDLNCTPWSAPFRTLGKTLKPVTKAPRTWPARLPLVPLDHILMRGPLRVVRSGSWTEGPAARASDHLPVLAELEYVA